MSHTVQQASAAVLAQLLLLDLPACVWQLRPDLPEVLSGELWTADPRDWADRYDRLTLWAAALNAVPETSAFPKGGGGVVSVSGRYLAADVQVWTRVDGPTLAVAMAAEQQAGEAR